MSGMLANVFLKGLRDQRRGLLGWGIGVTLIVVVMAALWPSIRDMPDLEQFLASYPEAFRELFDIGSMATGAGFLNAELFSILLPAMFILYGVGRGARLVAGEEEAGTLELLIVTPVSRGRILMEKAAALGVAVSALGAILFGVLLAASTAVGMDLAARHAAVASLAMVLLGIVHGWLALAVGAATGRRALAVAVGGAVAVAGYVLHAVGAMVEAFEPWRWLSPFTHALEPGPLGGPLPLTFLGMALAAVAFALLALPAFGRRDIAGR